MDLEKVKYHNTKIGTSQRINQIRRFACIVRSWYYFHVKWHGRVSYNGFVRVMHHTTFERKGITIGHNVQFGPYCRVMTEVEFHNSILMASSVIFVGKNDHTYNISCQTIWNGERGLDNKIVVEDDVWIGHGAVILAGVRVGKGSIVAAGAIVTKDIPPCEIWGGNPAHKIKDRFHTVEEKNNHLQWLDSVDFLEIQ